MNHHALACLFTLALASPVLAQYESDPAVLRGAELPSLLGASTDRIVAFRYTTQSSWKQIPVQIDQRIEAPFSTVLGGGSITYVGEFYADPLTYTGADTADPRFDANDELCFLVKDAGEVAPPSDPAGVLAGSRVGVVVHVPLVGPDRYVYLFRTAGGLQPDAGVDYVDYSFDLISGDYLTWYNPGSGVLNPEDSYVTATAYQLHFSDRWIHDGLLVEPITGASGAPILEGHRLQFEVGNCSRTELTFSVGAGAIIANVDGPVRAIRSVIGANSGTITERRWYFYPAMMQVVTDVRVHPIPGVWDYYDYNVNAFGMTYYDDLNQSGWTVDGVQDSATTGHIDWQLVTGVQGSLTHVFDVKTNPQIVLAETSNYFDAVLPMVPPCTGDGSLIGACGPQLPQLPWSDPLPNGHNPTGQYTEIQLWRTVFFERPGVTVADAIEHKDAVLNFPSSVEPL